VVLQYIPLIIVNGEKFLEKNVMCGLVQACDAILGDGVAE
jgi:saposin